MSNLEFNIKNLYDLPFDRWWDGSDFLTLKMAKPEKLETYRDFTLFVCNITNTHPDTPVILYRHRYNRAWDNYLSMLLNVEERHVALILKGDTLEELLQYYRAMGYNDYP